MKIAPTSADAIEKSPRENNLLRSLQEKFFPS